METYFDSEGLRRVIEFFNYGIYLRTIDEMNKCSCNGFQYKPGLNIGVRYDSDNDNDNDFEYPTISSNDMYSTFDRIRRKYSSIVDSDQSVILVSDNHDLSINSQQIRNNRKNVNVLKSIQQRIQKNHYKRCNKRNEKCQKWRYHKN